SSQPLPVFAQGSMIRIGGVAFIAEDDGARVDETRQVVDVAVRVVARDAFPQPEGASDAEEILEELFVPGAAESGIAHLHLRIEQAFLGGQERSLSVDVDGPA